MKARNSKNNRKFNKSLNFVSPLYRKVSFINKTASPTIFTTINTSNLGGNDFDSFKINKKTCESVFESDIPGLCSKEELDPKINIKNDKTTIVVHSFENKNVEMENLGSTSKNKKKDKSVNTEHLRHDQWLDTWLRFYPAPCEKKEGTISVFIRIVCCQIGLAVILTIWTTIWVYVINCFEEPYEEQAQREFEQQERNLVIELATELRQITPLSPKWRRAIEDRIDHARQITMEAVTKGVRLETGEYWTLCGTFLFTVSVMTALGFGAPVPQTVEGRCSCVAYALIAVPTHVYLMYQANACIVVKLENCMKKWLAEHESDSKENQQDQTSDSSEESKQKPIAQCFFKTIKILWILRGVPFLFLVYYVLGVICFGVLRSQEAVDAVMFPMEFTTTGGLAEIKGYIRVLYGIYVEGAMFLLTYSITCLKRYSGTAISYTTSKYRLFTGEHCVQK